MRLYAASERVRAQSNWQLSMTVVEEHRSPDGLLRLIVTCDDEGDVAIGFDGYAWHTHGDILASLSGLPEKEAIRDFVNHITGGRQIIAISRVNGEIRDVWPTDDPKKEFKYKPPEESLEFRRWSGQIVPLGVG
jgi:hypothetical protein